MKLKSAAPLLLSLLLVPVTAALADAQPYFTAKELDLQRFLPQPPANDSAQTQRELKEVLVFQAGRTPETVAAAQADAQESIWRFANVVGGEFNAQRLPKLAALSERVFETIESVEGPAKKAFKRPRPFALSAQVETCVKRSDSGSWPSGHSMVGYVYATLLGEMLPEKRDALFHRAAEYANNRVLCGVHYRSDLQAGQVGGSLIAQQLLANADFQRDLSAARSELRQAQGL